MLSRNKKNPSFTHRSRACSASHSAAPQSHEPSLNQAKRGPCLTSAHREKNWLLMPHGSKPLPIGKALHKWEAPVLPLQWLAEAGIIPVHQGPNIPTTHHSSVCTDFTSARRHRGMICISWTGIWVRELSGIDCFLYKLQLYGLASWSQKSQRGTLPVSHAGNI